MWSRAFVLRVLCCLCVSVSGVLGLRRDELYTHGYGHGLDHQLPPDDDSSSTEIPLRVPIVFYGRTYNSIYINMNGLLSFRTEIPYFLNTEFPLEYPCIAPFYSNVDTRRAGKVFYRETQDAYIIARASENVRTNFPQNTDFQPTSVFIASWIDVGYHDHGMDKTNTFQVAVITNGTDSFVELLYPENGLQWIQAKGQVGGLPDARAQAGFVGEDQRYYLLEGSGTEKVRMLTWGTNTDNNGQFMFRIGNLHQHGNVEKPMKNELDEYKSEPKECSQGGSNQCHAKAQCVDREYGFCCICMPGYYGNGKTCLKNDAPLRVNGKLTGQINNIVLDSVELQAFVVMSDGRSYTAFQKVPESIGYAMQTLNILGGIIGWLFAKPIGNVKNGYQLTGGVFNHTATIHFTESGDQITIKQQGKGLDVFDQLRMNIEVKGSIPNVPETRLDIADYDLQFSSSQPGLLMSESTRRFTSPEYGSTYTLVIDQSIEFDVCQYAPVEDSTIDPFSLKVGKNYLGFENTERIIRYGMSNKITTLGQEDPCIAGRETCPNQSSCIVDEDSFKCVCNPGYQYIYPQGSPPMCIDVNECSTGTHSCDANAQCINQEGSYSCQCFDGFEGNGDTCERAVSVCDRYQCDSNAQCYESQGQPFCRCNKGFTGDGNQCWESSETSCDVLKNCAENAMCSPDYKGVYVCTCLDGYSGDGYFCTLDEPETDTEVTPRNEQEDIIRPTCILSQCWCPSEYKLMENSCYKKDVFFSTTTESYQVSYPMPVCTDSGRCHCQYGYNYNEEMDRCVPDPRMPQTTKGSYTEYPCNVVNRCHPYAQCVVNPSDNTYQCECTAGYEGNGYDCEQVDVSCLVDPQICDIHASCRYDPGVGKNICICSPGYTGDGNVCQRYADCQTSDDCEKNAECKTIGNPRLMRRECVCLPGYSKDESDACIQEGGNCGGAVCAANAACQWDPEYQTHYCQCDSGYQGNGISECIIDSSGCDVSYNCGLNADCVMDANENKYYCTCNEGFIGDGYNCSADLSSCNYNIQLCSNEASCIMRNQKYVCECNPGFSGDGQTCELDYHEGNFLLLNQGMATLRVPFEPTRSDPGRPIHISYNQMAIGLDVDCTQGRVYWSDITGKSINSSSYDGSKIELFLGEGITSPEGLSIDWVSRNIYWTDSRQDTVEVANLDTRVRKVLFNTGLVDPRGIAVHPHRGKLFWSDWNREAPKIEWSNMDGTGRQIFLYGESVHLPNSLAIDWDSDELCYADAGTKSIECVEIDDPTRRNTVATNCSYPFGLAITRTHYYWTDWMTQKIESLNKRTGVREPPMSVPLGGSGNKLYGMAAVPEKCPPIGNACQYRNGDCPSGHLCLLNGAGARRCVCGKPYAGPPTCYE